MFEFNKNIECIEAFDSKIYIVDDFYKNPHEIINWISKIPRTIHKAHQTPSYNRVHFRDERHYIPVENINPIIEWMKEITGQEFDDLNTNCTFFSNWQSWVDNEFNSVHESSVWYPHLDYGYTALIYFDEESIGGTNLYLPKNEHERSNIAKINEHYEPWRSGDDWEVLVTLQSKFNRMVLFEADKFYHGLEFSPKYFNTPRLNQAIFFNREK
jgi:hypothetical protein